MGWVELPGSVRRQQMPRDMALFLEVDPEAEA